MYDISLPVMQTMQMRARRPATAGAAGGQARLQIGEGPGCVSGLSVQPGIMLLVPLGRLPPHISYMTKRARPVSGVVEGGNVRLCSLSGRKIVESAERGRCVRPLRGMGEGPGCADGPPVQPRMITLVTLISFVTNAGKIRRRPLE